MARGHLCLLLHCHLPFVRHPEHESFLEEDWFYEALTESYLPLQGLLEKLEREGVRFRLTICLSPPLCAMLTDELLRARYARYLQRRIALMEREVRRLKGTPLEEAAAVCRSTFLSAQEALGQSQVPLVGTLARLQREGLVEVITTSATHAMLPLLATPEALFAQVELGCRSYERLLGCRPRGFWLPECAYTPGLEEVLAGCGLQFFFLDSHGILLAEPGPVSGVFAPLVTPAGPAAFGRDMESSKQVWSGTEGYPGDAVYRDFHRDLGHDAPLEDIRECLSAGEVRHNIGVKYYAVTDVGQSERKEPYRPRPAGEKAAEHAAHFLASRGRQVSRLVPVIGRPPLIVSPYDAELFGHWWFEGPQFLEGVLRGAASGKDGVLPVTPSQYLAENPVQQVSRPAVSTWGEGGYFEVWMNESNDWIHPPLHEAEKAMVELAGRHPRAQGTLRRALAQCARELLLAQSSDWPFLMYVRTARHYASRRVREHLDRFSALAGQVRAGRIDPRSLADLEGRDNIFPDVDYALFAPR